ncbi:hypothetical protein A3F02_03450 [Candidatus Curtissbacteria bacterium RIFCSPHIGHO2_12_FULL_38_9b]|uniref:Addiction module antitoxin, RelB/DinJ family n=2 Tax=Candidatus Curtissiibacteriota TaxID=1752717 RepID=A0A1F5GZN9_9BACT|nr:MAG: hypothetical protein A3A48_00060 [Candidatus Curtissbacteria bacterium RIFCSPLOWO2_01_FULL_37_9]OGD97338.1 MAG: hypothetical protein A3F02_03450 [Candidatus Curtissbacteria bacterium RIFCSPHIGHO2_12_FULL_38_9b]
MSYAVVTTKVDPQTKKEAQKTAEKLGMPLSVVIKAFLKQFIRTQSVSFGTLDEEPSEYLKNAIRQAQKDWKAGRTSPAFKTGEEAVAWLEKQGI